MAKLRIFVSSTCYDLGILRSELRPFIVNMGHEPVMSEYSDVLYDHRSHTHTNCLAEVRGCDMVILVIGSRFGGKAVPEAHSEIDFEELGKVSKSNEILRDRHTLSITQLEIFSAIENRIPVYVFVDEGVYHDHHVYEKNKGKARVIKNIDFPSIQKKETAKYIFEFINFLNHRFTNNSIIRFSRLDEIRVHLMSQWSQLFQRLLFESRTGEKEAARYADFSERLEDLKAIVVASVNSSSLPEVAKRAVQFRHLIQFVSTLTGSHRKELLLSDLNWVDLMKMADVREIRVLDSGHGELYRSQKCYVVLNDNTFFVARYSKKTLDENFPQEWGEFLRLDDKVRDAIVSGLLEDYGPRSMAPVRYFNKKFDEFVAESNMAANALGWTLLTGFEPTPNKNMRD